MKNQKQALIDNFLFCEAREPVFLAKTEGKTFPYMNSRVPEIFRQPLMVSEKGELGGWKSGGRSALVHHKGKWYDIEGVRPSVKEWASGIPEGGDTRLEAENELKAGVIFQQYGQRNHISALMKPVCLFKYSKIRFQGEAVYASVLETKGDLRLSHFLGEYLTVAAQAFESLKDDSRREAKVNLIMNRIKEGITDKIGQWAGFWYRCLDENKLLWGTSYDKKNKVYSLNSNAGNNNLTVYRVKDKVAIGVVDLNGFRVSEPVAKNLEADRIKKRLSIFEMALHILKVGKSATNISQYQLSQTWASKLYTKIAPPKGINIYQQQYGFDPLEELELPRIDDLDIIKCFNEGRKEAKPEFIEEKFITNIKEMFLS